MKTKILGICLSILLLFFSVKIQGQTVVQPQMGGTGQTSYPIGMLVTAGTGLSVYIVGPEFL